MEFLLGLLKLVSIVFANIEIKLSTYNFKDDIFNLYYGLSIHYNFSTNVISAIYLASFNLCLHSWQARY